MALVRHFINGQDAGEPTRTGTIYNPATGAAQHDLILGSVADVGQAIAAALV